MRDGSPSIPIVDRSAARFDVPGGLALAGVFGGALVLAGLAFETVGLSAAAVFAVVGASGVVVVRRLNAAHAAVERSTRQVEEAGSRLQVLVEHVPAAVYIDMADPGRLRRRSARLHEPADQRDPRLPARGVRRRPGALAEPDPPGRSGRGDRGLWPSIGETGEPLRAEYRMLARDGTEIWVRDEAYAMPDDTRAAGGSRRACSSTRPTGSGLSPSSSTTRSTTR